MKAINKKQKRAESIYALKNLLLEVTKYPNEWHTNQDLIEALKAQGKLAKWSDQARGIEAASLNTLKNAAEEFLEGGYATLDKLRQCALAEIIFYKEKNQAGNTRTKTGLQKKLKEQERCIKILEQQNMMLVYLLTELKDKAVKYASEGPDTIQSLCKREMAEINAKIRFSGNAKLIVNTLQDETT